MITALLVAVRDTIRNQLKYDSSTCIIQDNARPAPSCGPVFVAIYGENWSPDILDQNLGIDERADIAVTITQRMSAVPYDIRGEEIYVRQCLDIETTAHRIKCLVHQNYALITLANSFLTGDNLIMEPLRWLGGDAQPQTVDNDWFSSDDPNPYAGLTFTIRFGRARRMQTLTNIK